MCENVAGSSPKGSKIGAMVKEVSFLPLKTRKATLHLREAEHHWATAHIICGLPQHHSFVSVEMRNDVFATLIMMLTFGQIMLCPLDTNEKTSFQRTRFFGAPAGSMYEPLL